MKFAVAALANTCLLGSVTGIRVGEEEQATVFANSTARGDDEQATKKLQDWFENNKLPSGEIEKMDGSVDDPIWAYMKSDCFQGRYRTTAKDILQRDCKRVIEIGGYLTPLDKFLLEAAGGDKEGKNSKGDSLLQGPGKGKDAKSGGLPALYVNIDPSMPEAKVQKEQGMKIVHLPMTLADFFSDEAKTLRDEFQLDISKDDSCTMAFGIWDPHYKNPEDEEAMLKLYKNVKFAAAETSDYAKKWLKKTAKVAKKAGLSLVRDEDADCIEALKGQKPDSSLLRHMKFFERGAGKEEKKEAKPPKPLESKKV